MDIEQLKLVVALTKAKVDILLLKNVNSGYDWYQIGEENQKQMLAALADIETTLSQIRERKEVRAVNICNYPDCGCAFDMGSDNKCLQGFTNSGCTMSDKSVFERTAKEFFASIDLSKTDGIYDSPITGVYYHWWRATLDQAAKVCEEAERAPHYNGMTNEDYKYLAIGVACAIKDKILELQGN